MVADRRVAVAVLGRGFQHLPDRSAPTVDRSNATVTTASVRTPSMSRFTPDAP
jgi:hypothetical protein